MRIAGKEIDLDLYVEEAKEETIMEFNAYYSSDDYDNMDMINFNLANCLFERIVVTKTADNFVGKNEGNITAEKAIAEMFRNGLDKKDIIYRNDSFILKLKNREYMINKKDPGFIASLLYPEGGAHKYYITGISAEMFSNFLFDFDTLIIPELEKHEEEIRSLLMMSFIKIIKERKARSDQQHLIENTINEMIGPLGLISDYQIENDRVILTLEERKRGVFNFRINELSEKLQDKQSILDGLETISPEKYYRKRSPFDTFDNFEELLFQ